jgi:hypothetical protein
MWRIFGGRSRVHAPNQHDTVTVEDWRLLKLNIRVRFPFPSDAPRIYPCDQLSKPSQPDSVHTVKDALAHISSSNPVQIGQSQEVQIETLPSILVLHLERFPYDVAADGIDKISKPIQFTPELEIPLGTINSFVSPVLAKTKNPSLLGLSRNHGTHFWKICGAAALQALRGASPPRRIRRQWALYRRRAPSKCRQR